MPVVIVALGLIWVISTVLIVTLILWPRDAGE